MSDLRRSVLFAVVASGLFIYFVHSVWFPTPVPAQAPLIRHQVKSYEHLTPVESDSSVVSNRDIDSSVLKTDNIKHILLWHPRSTFFDAIDLGFASFEINRCPFTNCYVSENKSLPNSSIDFDAVVFNGKYLGRNGLLPDQRLENQKYIFAATESSQNYPICDSRYDGYFNWTWTYKLDSDFRWGYVTIYNLEGQVVGPKMDMVWPDLQQSPVSDELKEKLSRKSKGASWFVTNCNTKGKRENFYHESVRELAQLKYSWTIDVFGSCGIKAHSCPRSNAAACDKMVEDNYHFYFAFENTFSEGYVTEKLVRALENYAIPVVYGGANYTQFLPPGSYLNARELGPRRLVETMNEIIHDKERFYQFFRWRNHFRYKDTVETTELCNLCTALNNEVEVKRLSAHQHFRAWWNDGRCGT